MASKMAFTAMSIMVHHRNMPLMVNVGGLQSGPFAALMADVVKDLGDISNDVLEDTQRYPVGVAAHTHRAVRQVAMNVTDKAWQDGPRSATKSTALAGDEQAEAVFVAKANERSKLLPVCYAQTVKGAPLPQAQREKYQALSPAAKAIAQTAAVMGDDFHRNLMVTVNDGKVSPNDWAALHEAGFLENGKIASRQVAAFMKRGADPSFWARLGELKSSLAQQMTDDQSKALIRMKDVAQTRALAVAPLDMAHRTAQFLSPDSGGDPGFGSLHVE
jgi:hypothetical protein